MPSNFPLKGGLPCNAAGYLDNLGRCVVSQYDKFPKWDLLYHKGVQYLE